jgi:alkylation response protein AidB-like acyl-CoA dehydrogenase
MRVAFTEGERAFRDRVAEWIANNLPRSWPAEEDFPARRRADCEWQRTLFDAGYAGLAWPKEFGGAGMTPMEELIFQVELAKAGAPSVDSRMVGLGHAGPTLMAVGSKEQQIHLSAILRGDEIWSQGFSEPGAGSDLAALRTSGRVQGDTLIVNGQKVWSSWAQIADFQELLVRTEPGSVKHQGISWVICDMQTPGITVRPIRTMTGASHFCEVFYDEVRIPLSNVVGGLGNGWRTAMVTLSFERGTHFIATQVGQTYAVKRLMKLAAATNRGSDLVFFRRRLAALAIEAEALQAMSYRTVSRVQQTGNAGPSASLLKLLTVDLVEKVAEIGMEIAGPDGLFADCEYAREWMMQFAHVFGGGTPEIQRNVIAERVLGLPR